MTLTESEPTTPIEPAADHAPGDREMTMLEHLDELRQRLVAAVIAVVAGIVVALIPIPGYGSITEILFHLMAGFAALFQDQVFVARSADLLISVSYDTWGWAHIVLGVVGIVAAYLLMRGNMVGRVLGVVIAALSALTNVAFLTAQPVWAVIAIGFDVLVIYGITVHGGELKPSW